MFSKIAKWYFIKNKFRVLTIKQNYLFLKNWKEKSAQILTT